MKQRTLKQGVKDFLGIVLLYVIIIIGVVLVNNRMGDINAQKNTTQQNVEVVQRDDAR